MKQLSSFCWVHLLDILYPNLIKLENTIFLLYTDDTYVLQNVVGNFILEPDKTERFKPEANLSANIMDVTKLGSWWFIEYNYQLHQKKQCESFMILKYRTGKKLVNNFLQIDKLLLLQFAIFFYFFTDFDPCNFMQTLLANSCLIDRKNNACIFCLNLWIISAS